MGLSLDSRSSQRQKKILKEAEEDTKLIFIEAADLKSKENVG